MSGTREAAVEGAGQEKCGGISKRGIGTGDGGEGFMEAE